MPFSPGETFRLKEPRSPYRHLYVILGCNSEELIAVRLNTVNALTDPTVRLKAGDHPFIKHDTAVSYETMREFSISLLEKLEQESARSAEPQFEWHAPCSPELLQKLRSGALHSDRSVPRITKALLSMFETDA